MLVLTLPDAASVSQISSSLVVTAFMALLTEHDRQHLTRRTAEPESRLLPHPQAPDWTSFTLTT